MSKIPFNNDGRKGYLRILHIMLSALALVAEGLEHFLVEEGMIIIGLAFLYAFAHAINDL